MVGPCYLSDNTTVNSVSRPRMLMSERLAIERHANQLIQLLRNDDVLRSELAFAGGEFGDNIDVDEEVGEHPQQ